MNMLYNYDIRVGDKVWWYTLYAHTYQIHNGVVERKDYYMSKENEYPDIITNQPINESQEFYASKEDVLDALKEHYLFLLNTAEKNLNLLNRDDSDDV